ncbi:intron Large complex component GCFC2 [Mixophyes fleayi]|uniref:intron Large complex component GCFC2 n=1 Tax=Mixophyes fleayi TaxID=3061075 RepID=UPI003F4E2892
MFRKPNRNLRVRKAASSDEEHEGGQEHSQVERPKRPGGRGLTCGTKKCKAAADGSASDEEQPGDKAPGNTVLAKPDPIPLGTGPPSILSFSEEREEEVSFRLRKPTENTVVFKLQRKAEHIDHASKPKENGSEGDTSSESEHSENEDIDWLKKEDSPSTASNSPPASPQTLLAGEIPDAKRIRAARRQRTRARAQGEYISLDASHEGSDSSPSQSDHELDDHERRIKFAPGVKTIKEQMADEMSSASDHDSEGREADDSQDRWEEQQISKGLKRPQTMNKGFLHGRSPPPVKRPIEPKFSVLLVTVEDIRKKLTGRIASVQEVHRSHVVESDKYARDLENSKNILQMLEKSSSEQSYKFLKEMKIYVENFVDCLNEKIVRIKELEAEMFQILADRTRTLVQRRQDDLRTESAAVQRSGKPGDVETAEEITQNQLQDIELRRARRRQKREDSGQKDHHEGMSTDDEQSLDQQTDLRISREDILLQCKSIFEDVHEDFSQIKNILSKFRVWREQYPESYYDAYINLCIHKLLSPLVQLQLIGWNPLEDNAELDQMPWYCDLEDFCFTRDENTEDSPDLKVLTAVVEKTVIPKVSGYIEHVWDPMSSVQTDRLVHFCKAYVLENDSSKAVQGLVSCLVSRLKKAIEDDVYIPLYAKRLLEDRNSPHSKFQDRQFWSAVKLLSNVLCWDGFLDEETLQELGLDKLLNRYLLLILLNAEPDFKLVDKCCKITECLPQSWFKGLDNGSSLARLANFSKHLVQSIHALHKLDDRKNMEVLVSLLVKIKAQNYAEEIITQYKMEGHRVAV